MIATKVTLLKCMHCSGSANTTVKKQLAHIIFEVQQIARRDPQEYGPYFSEAEIERIRDVCKGRWYNMTCDAISEVYFKVSLPLCYSLLMITLL